MPGETILKEKDGGLLILTLNRPEEANALNYDLAKDFYETMVECSNDPSVRSVLLTGKGKIFCGGGDLNYFLSHKEDMKETLTRMTHLIHGGVALMAQMDAPVVIAVNGTAGGGGFSLAISGDIIYSAESAKFTSAYTKAALSPDASSTYYLPRLVGLRRAKELMLTNRVLSAKEACEMGLIDQVFNDEELMGAALKQAKKFAEGPTKAYASVKKLLNTTFTSTLAQQLEHEAHHIAMNASSRDGKEGIDAFTKKRKPEYTGE